MKMPQVSISLVEQSKEVVEETIFDDTGIADLEVTEVIIPEEPSAAPTVSPKPTPAKQPTPSPSAITVPSFPPTLTPQHKLTEPFT